MKRGTYQMFAVAIAVALLLIACSSSAPTVAPTKPSAPVPPAATAPAVSAAAPTAAKPAVPTATPTAKIKRGGVARLGIQNDWTSQDPVVSSVDSPSFQMIYENLVFWRPDSKGIWGPTPGLATEWELKDKTATFKLRKGVKFHDGSEWNAEVAKWNMDRMLLPTSNTVLFKDGVASTDIIDDYTIRINLKVPYGPLLAILSDAEYKYLMVSKAYVDKNGPEAHTRNPVGTGPFQFVEWKTGDSLSTKRWDNYWMQGADGKPLPYLDGVLFRWISDDSVRLLELKAGNLDFTELIQGKDIPSVKTNPELAFIEADYNGNLYRVMLGADSDPFGKNLKLRQATWYALDREALANTLGLGAGRASRYMIIPGQIGYDESVPYYWYDKAKAAQLVKDAGYPNGLDITYSVMSREVDRRQAEMVKQMWDAIGIRTTLEVLERVAWGSKFYQTQGNQKLQAGSWRNVAAAHSVISVNNNWFSKDTNPAHQNDPEIDKCLEEVKSYYDAKLAHEAMKRCQTLDYERAAYYAMPWYQTWNWAYRKVLKGVGANYDTRIWQLREAWLDN